MYGLEAISFHNGWAMALAGALIVFAGLVVLSTVIAQLHKILTFWEKRHIKIEQKHKMPTEEESALPSATQLPAEKKNRSLPRDLRKLSKDRGPW